MKIRIFQPIVPEYRVALFNGLGRRYGGDIDIWASEGEGQDRSCALTFIRYDYSHPFRNFGPFRWQEGLSLSGLSKGDVIVVCGDLHQVSSLWVAAKAKIKGVKVVWWGHHVSSTSRAWGIKMRLFFTKLLADVVLCYTQSGIEWFAVRKWTTPVFATGNTIDMEAVKSAIAFWNDQKLSEFQENQDLKNQEVIAICGVLRWKIHLEHLLHAMASDQFKARGTKLVVIGDGEGRGDWMKLAQKLGVEDRIVWAGALRKQLDIAPWLLSSKVFAYPGVIGLSIIHAFAYGLPVVCHSNQAHHGPEFSAQDNGKTGFVFEEGNVNDLADKVLQVLGDDALQSEMSRYVQQIAFTKYGIDSMIDNYCKAIEVAAKGVGHDRN